MRHSETKEIMEIGAFFNAAAEDYDEYHCSVIDGGIDSKHIVASFLPEDCANILDLGAGTGIELQKIFERFPNTRVTAVDLSIEMLKKLRGKYPDKNIDIKNISYFDYDFSAAPFDAAVSVMTLHHFDYVQKLDIYTRIANSLRPGGAYVECDYMALSQDDEDSYFAEHERLCAENPDIHGFIHYDTPITPENQIAIIKCAGFKKVERVWQEGKTVILRATV